MYKEITSCRICGNTNLVSLIYLGEQALTGVFPRNKGDKITSGPLELVKCHPATEKDVVCHLVQLRHSYDSREMYGLNYGYRSGLNPSMVEHLKSVVQCILATVNLEKGDLIIDIGSNDSTLLQHYPTDKGYELTGIDPTGAKFKPYYPPSIKLIPDFFSSELVKNFFSGKKVKVITSIAMFYDLEDPVAFVKNIHTALADDGIWIFEQSYLPSMLETNAYDTICHEHLEYYALYQVKYILDKVGFRIVNVVSNDVNGGSFRVTAAKGNSGYPVDKSVMEHVEAEKKLQLDTLKPYEEFRKKVEMHKKSFISLIHGIKEKGKLICGYGASTKGNVILQYCGISAQDIPFIAEVNEDKYGSFTPFTHIPIISEKEARAKMPDYFLVLPWHFRKGIIEKEKKFLKSGGKFIFPLPEIEVVGL